MLLQAPLSLLVELLFVVLAFLVLLHIRLAKQQYQQTSPIRLYHPALRLVTATLYPVVWIGVGVVVLYSVSRFISSDNVAPNSLFIRCLLFAFWFLLGIVIAWFDRAAYGAVIGITIIAPIGSIGAFVLGCLIGAGVTGVMSFGIVVFGEMMIDVSQLMILGSLFYGFMFGLIALIGLMPAAAVIGACTGLLSHMERYFRKEVV